MNFGGEFLELKLVEDPAKAPAIELDPFEQSPFDEGLILPKFLGGCQVGHIDDHQTAGLAFAIVAQ